MQLELADAERDALARFLRSAIDADRYPLSPRLTPLKAILTKLDQKPQAQPEPGTPNRVMSRKLTLSGSVNRRLRPASLPSSLFRPAFLSPTYSKTPTPTWIGVNHWNPEFLSFRDNSLFGRLGKLPFDLP